MGQTGEELNLKGIKIHNEKEPRKRRAVAYLFIYL